MDVIRSDGTWMVHDVIVSHHVLSSDHDGTWMYIYIYGLQQKNTYYNNYLGDQVEVRNG